MLRRSPEVIANEIRLRRQLFSGAFVLTEGSTDAMVLEGLVSRETCHVLGVGGREALLYLLDILNREGLAGVVAVADVDFDRILGATNNLRNLYFTDSHDLDVMILESEALTKVLRAHGSATKIETAERGWNSSVRDRLFDLALPLGALRLLSHRESLGLTFEDLSFTNFVSRESLTVNTERMIDTVLNRSSRFDLDRRGVRFRLDEIIAENNDSRMMCVGPDMINILHLGLRHVLGSKTVNEISIEQLKIDLRLAYEAQFFRDTELFEKLSGWERDNPGFSFGIR